MESSLAHRSHIVVRYRMPWSFTDLEDRRPVLTSLWHRNDGQQL